MSWVWVALALVVSVLIAVLWIVLGRSTPPSADGNSESSSPDVSMGDPVGEQVLYSTPIAPGLKMELFAKPRSSSRAEDELLSNFHRLERIDRYTAADYLDAELGRSRWAVLDEFDRERLTRLATPSEVLNHEHKLDSLRAMCRAENLKVSGKKAEVIARLLTANPLRVPLEQCSAYRTLTDAGIARVESYYREEERSWNAVAAAIIAALDRDDISAVVEIAQHYSESLTGPVMAVQGDMARSYVAGMWATPGESRATRIYAVLMGTIGTSFPGKWWLDRQSPQPEGTAADTEEKERLSKAASLIVRDGKHMEIFGVRIPRDADQQRALGRQLAEADLRKLKVITTEAEISAGQEGCPSCKALEGVWNIDRALEEMPLPNEDCSRYKHSFTMHCCASWELPRDYVDRLLRSETHTEPPKPFAS
ncbi:SAP domain-containing protein [Aquabacterium sp.]|uniref:SAP domain-containing protein n=1 Tax=Aquabacterium sp. TaxID=1872578 RepID=UPI00260169CB|nr:SAP domain-containing protein [Aquabacterium sp.]MDD2978222.1 SAP domain-containing protein [Aquabacterium sp.]